MLVAKFNYQGNRYVFEKPAGNQGVVTISNGTASGGSWSSTQPISAVVVKGGPGAFATTYDPPQTLGTFSNRGLPPVGQGNLPDISNLQFCGSVVPPSTTSSSTSTSSTSTSSTSTSTSSTSTSSTSSTSTSSTSTSSTSTSTSTSSTSTSTTTSTTQPTTSTSQGPTTTTVGGAVVTATTVVKNVSGESLPFTGGASTALIVIGLLLLVSGLALIVVSRFREQRTHA